MPSSFFRPSVAMTTVAATLLVFLILEMGQVANAATGCRGAQMCCRQKDNSCRVPGQRMNHYNKSYHHGFKHTCFCDAGCLELGDCCIDYRHFCAGDFWSIISAIAINGKATFWNSCDIYRPTSKLYVTRLITVFFESYPTCSACVFVNRRCSSGLWTELGMVRLGRLQRTVWSRSKGTTSTHCPTRSKRREAVSSNGHCPTSGLWGCYV